LVGNIQAVAEMTTQSVQQRAVQQDFV